MISVVRLFLFKIALTLKSQAELQIETDVLAISTRPNLGIKVLTKGRAVTVRRAILEFVVAQLNEILPGATWTAAGLGRHQLDVNHWALELAGPCRTGLEDNIRFDKTRLAASNAKLVCRVADHCVAYGRHRASIDEARSVLGFRSG